MNKRYNSINQWLKNRFGERIYKVSLKSGCPCPNLDGTISDKGCIFCNLKGIEPLVPSEYREGPISIKEQLESGIEYIKRRHGVGRVIAYFQSGSNTNAPASSLSPIFWEALNHPLVVGLAISTRPDCINKDHIQLFKGLMGKTLLWIELGLQSASDKTLKLIRRGHDVAQFVKTCRELKKAEIPVCAHVILGLPGENMATMLSTAHLLNELDVWGVKIHNLHILRGTELESLFQRGKITVPSLTTYANWAVSFLEVLKPSIVVHRVNSHSPRELTVEPDWSINKLAILNEVEKLLKERNTKQGRLYNEG